MVVCVVQLEHADAEYLASISKPFLSLEGSIVPYVTANVIIIKDRQPVVDMLTKLIKGKPCTPISQSSGAKMRDRQAKSHLDQWQFFFMAAPIYHFLICTISFANLKNFGFLRLHQHSRNLKFSPSMDFDS